MFKKKIKYTDYNGEVREETFYFNLNKAELMEMEYSKEGGLSAALRRIVEEKSKPKLWHAFKDILLAAYGEKSEDGKRFIKSKELSEAFAQTEAYNNLFLELCSQEEGLGWVKFITEIIPEDMRGEIPPDIQEKLTNNVA